MTDFPGVEVRPFGTTQGGEAVEAYVLTNRKGAQATILSYAGTLAELTVPDRDGKLGSVVLGFDGDEVRPYEGSPHFGALVGRVANRIAQGRFTLDGREYVLATNNGPNALHGGPKGYSKRVWTVAPRHDSEGPSLRLTIDDPDGHEGYPGHVSVEVRYTWTDSDVLRIAYRATTDAPTPINLTNHVYLNLKDGGATEVLGHLVRLEADAYTPVDETLIPTGELRPVANTPFDFRESRPIGADIEAVPGGYDHNFVLKPDGPRLALAAMVDEPVTRRHLEVWTDQPGVQFYTGNFLDGSLAGRGGPIHRHAGFCLETQRFPDSVNHDGFPSVILRPGEEFRSTTEYRFSVAKGS